MITRSITPTNLSSPKVQAPTPVRVGVFALARIRSSRQLFVLAHPPRLIIGSIGKKRVMYITSGGSRYAHQAGLMFYLSAKPLITDKGADNDTQRLCSNR